jgi:hypothetical protein
MVLSLQKYPTFTLVLANAIVLVSVAKQRRRASGRKQLSYRPILVAVILGVLFAVYFGTGEKRNFIVAGLDRAFVVPAGSTYAVHRAFPERHPFLYFDGSRTLHFFLGLGRNADYSSDYKTVALVASDLMAGIPYSLNTSILGDGWGNFGYLGIEECALILFGVYFLWDRHFARRQQGLPLAPLLAYFVASFATIVNGDLMYILTKQSIIATPMVFIFLARRRRWPTTGAARRSSLRGAGVNLEA